MRNTEVAAAPKLPDVKGCCYKAGINHNGCVEKLCDPTKTYEIAVTDLMICAPWAGITFGCLANGIDHSPCCRARGLPDTCLPLCSGNITSLDFNHFKCLRYMTAYTNCLLQGYGVLPGPPSRLHLTNIDTDYAVVHWAPPTVLSDTVQYYHLHFKSLQSEEDYRTLDKVQSPYILEDLESNTDYEIYVEAVNEHGVGESSPRLIFRTQSQVIEEEEEAALAYNVTACCSNVGVSSVCMPLCAYDARMSDLRSLAPLCDRDFPNIVRCGAGGRNHDQCCARRGVPRTCSSVCTGAAQVSLFYSCVAYIGNVVQCFEEGTGTLPGPPREVHAVISRDKLFLDWSPPVDGANATSYTVHWQKVGNNTQPYYYNTLQLDNKINVTETMARIENLQVNSSYHMFVVAANEHGTSLPSSMLLVNITDGDSENKEVSGIPSPPHSLSVASHSATWLALSWQPPQFSLPDEKISYTLYFKTTSSQSNITKITTSVTGHTLEKLSPNTQYVAWVVATAGAGNSPPSETLLAWTDPAYPAFVEPPTINPVNLVVEGSSMTILCIAMGTPTPTISLYISGRLVRQEVTRHMVTVVHNVTRDMELVSCYADNGYGTPMQASRKINISHIPTIQASGITMAAAGDSVILECRVEALPKPTIAFWRDPNGRTPVIDGPNYTIQLLADPEEKTKYTMRLIIKKITEADEGDYFCHAENAFGKTLRPVSVRLRASGPHHNVTECCTQMNVSSSCIDACSFHLDMDNIMDRPECMNDFDKLMKCAADGSDHRSCCASWGVPRNCLELCRGGSVSKSCALQHARRALACFRDSGAKLPGPPRNLKAHAAPTPNSVLLSWEPPLKNPQTVYLYRVFWRAYGAKVPEKLDTSETSVVLTGLQDDVRYECVVKAANDAGTSSLSQSIMFTTAGQETVTLASKVSTSGTASAVGVAVACILVAAILLAAGLYYRHRKNLRLKAQGGVAFENPSYLREPNPDSVVNGIVPNGTANDNTNIIGNGISTSTAWRQETQNPGSTVSQREVDPSLYEELKLGSSKNTKLNMPHEAKYCDVPYNNSVNNELKSVRNPDIPMTNINPAFGRSVPPYGWPHGVNVRPLRPYGAPDFYQYSDYPSCAGPRPMQMVRQHQALNGDTSQMYPDHLYQESNIRFKPYPLAKERQQQVRYDYISNYPNTFHPPNPFPSHRYDVQKSIHGHPYPVYPQIPIKYLDRRIHEPITDSYQRSPNTPNFNMAYRNQPVAPPYGPLSGNCVQAKPYPPDGSIKPNNKLPFDSSSKVYADLEPKHNKGYPTSDNLYLNEINHHQSLRGDILLPPHSLNMHTVPQHAMYRKDNTYPKNFEYNIQYRNFDQTMNNSLPRFPFQYSPNTLAISPSDSNTSNDTAHTLGTPQEDCGYVSQSSTTSVRSLDSYNIQATNDALRRHNFNTYGLHRNNGKEMIAKRKSSSSDKKNINVRQFLQMWNEGDDDVSEPNKETVTSNNTVKNDDEPLYVLGLVNVPSNEIGKYEHIQKISKLPENIKGYNSLELLNQYEELLEPSNSDKYASNQLMTRQCNPSLRNRINKEHVTVPRPVSPLDVEAKISQSVIHKEVGCNFEIKPCSPEMLNVEIATPVQNILGERTIEKVINPVITHSPLLQHVENNIQNSNVIKNSSCKMLNHPFTPEPSSGNIKANNMYNNAQDLETNSGVCLASLPQLDNDLELNFPEINQQFINANKKGSNTQLSSKSLNLIDADQKHTVLNEKSGHQQINLLSPHTPSSTEKEVSKLSKYRKNKKVEPTAPSPNDFTKSIILPVTTQRIDSVIIKNPDNIKLQDFQSSTAYGLNTLLEDSNQNFNNNLSLEKAIDFSLNKIEVEIPMDNILNNINHTEDHIIEDHCNAITTCNDVNEDVEKNKHDSTLKQDYDTENKINQTVPLENIPRSSEIEKDIFNTRQNEHNKNISSSETLPGGIGTLQDNSLMKMTQNSGIEDHHKPITTSDNISQNCQIKQENFSFNLQQENKKTDHVNIAKNILSSYENDSKNVTIKQDEFSNICQFPSSTGNSSCGDILSHNSKDISEGQNLNNSIDVVNKNDTLKIEPSVLSVIHARTTSEEVSLFSDTHSNTNKNKSVINKSEIEISEITTQKVSEAKRNFPEISLPVLENFPNKGSELFDTTLKDSVMKNMEQFTLPHADEITIMCNENICNQTKEIANSSFQQNDDESKLVNNLPDTNLSKTSTGFDEILHDNAVLHTEKTYDESENNPNSFSNIKSFKPIEQNFENENKDFYNNVASVDSEIKYDECLTNKIELNDTSEEKGLDTAVLENFDPEKLLETVQFYKGESQSAIEKQNENLESDSKDISNTNKIDTSVINEISIEATKTVILNEVSDSCKENQSQNNLDTLKISLAQSEHILVNDNINVDLNLNEVCNKSSFELNEIKNIITDAEMIGDERNISNNLKNVSKLNDETQDKQSFCKRNIKIHKNLFSPWIQKLIMHTEGINVIENKLSNDKRSNESVDELQFTSNSFEKDDIEIKDLKNPLNIFNGTDISVNANDSQENTIDTSDTTLVLILSTDNQKNDLRTVDEIKNCVAITPNEASRQKFEESLDREVTVETKVSKKSQFFGNRPQKLLKRSLSESAIDNRNNDGPNLLIPTKRRKENNVLQSHITAEDLCNIVQSNRRNSVSTFYNEDSVYILIDNDLIITEQSDDSDKTCYTDTDVCNANEECESVFEKTDKNMSDFVPSESFENDDHLNELRSTDEKTAEESWVEDVACIETVFSDDVAEDITIDETKSPNITSEEFFENDDLNIYEEMSESTLIDKVRNIYGSSVSNENIQFLETMYRTPQMNVSRTLVDKESHNLETLQTHVQDNESHKLETVYLSHHNSLIDDKENLSNDSMLESKTLKTYSDEKENSVNVLLSNDSLNECIVHSCETTKEHFTSDIQKDNSHYSYSSSPEVSSTTSEEKGILLKITNYNGSRSSQINDITDDINKISYKLTENKEYRSYKSNFSSTRTLITKAAQKYIPPLKESIGDLKVKLPLPQHHLNKLKQLKKSKVEPKITENIIRYTNRNIKADIPKKVKPKFEDVLKSIDEIQFKQRKDKVKRGKSQIPKVVIKKSENGAHYTSSNALNNEVYNPDLTGRKWQPWVFMEKNNFIDRMAIKKKYKAVYCHRKKTYVLAEKFRKYKSVYNAKFVITQPKSGNTTNGNLKYTIRLQHK